MKNNKNTRIKLVRTFRKETNEKTVKTREYGEYICVCGNHFEVLTKSIKSGRTKSCGCLQKQMAKKAKTTHGLSSHPIYKLFSGMKNRCYNSNDYHFEWYVGRGIKICQEWLTDFNAFFDWSIKNGWEKGLEIDRIDNNQNYSPENCHFVNHKENIENTREIIKTNTSGYRNISKVGKKYRVIVKSKHIGMFKTIKDALKARNNSHTRVFNA